MTRREQAVAVAQLGDTRFDQVIGEEAAEAALAAACKRAQDCGATRVESRLVEGDAVHVLLQLAEDRAADLIVVGNRGINTRLGRILGSVPSVVSHPLPRPSSPRASRGGRSCGPDVTLTAITRQVIAASVTPSSIARPSGDARFDQPASMADLRERGAEDSSPVSVDRDRFLAVAGRNLSARSTNWARM